MRTVPGTRTLVVVGARPRRSAIEVLGDVPAGGEAVLVVLGLRATLDQQRLTEEALGLAAERRFTLTAEISEGQERLMDRVREATVVRITAARRERRRWNLVDEGPLSAPGAR